MDFIELLNYCLYTYRLIINYQQSRNYQLILLYMCSLLVRYKIVVIN